MIGYVSFFNHYHRVDKEIILNKLLVGDLGVFRPQYSKILFSDEFKPLLKELYLTLILHNHVFWHFLKDLKIIAHPNDVREILIRYLNPQRRSKDVIPRWSISKIVNPVSSDFMWTREGVKFKYEDIISVYSKTDSDDKIHTPQSASIRLYHYRTMGDTDSKYPSPGIDFILDLVNEDDLTFIMCKCVFRGFYKAGEVCYDYGAPIKSEYCQVLVREYVSGQTLAKHLKFVKKINWFITRGFPSSILKKLELEEQPTYIPHLI